MCHMCVYIYLCIYIYYIIYIYIYIIFYIYPNLWGLIWCVLSHDCFDWPSPPSPGVNHWALGSGHWRPPRPRRTRSGLETYAVAPCSMQVLSSRLSMPRWWGLVSSAWLGNHPKNMRIECGYGGIHTFKAFLSIYVATMVDVYSLDRRISRWFGCVCMFPLNFQRKPPTKKQQVVCWLVDIYPLVN